MISGVLPSLNYKPRRFQQGGWNSSLPRFHLRESVSRADEALAAQIVDAKAPFWQHVRDALAERHP